MSRSLAQYRQNMLVPANHSQAGLVFTLAGTNRRNYEGEAALALTPDALVLCTAQGVIEKISLWSIEDVQVVRFDGVLFELHSSVGNVLTRPPDVFGIDVLYSLDLRLKGHLAVLTFFANIAHQWAGDIRAAAHNAQINQLRKYSIERK